jgi:hypothetical protein
MDTHQAFGDHTGGLELDVSRTSASISVEAERCLTTLSYDEPSHTTGPFDIQSLDYIVDVPSEGASQFCDSDQDAERETNDEDDYDCDVRNLTYITPSPELVVRRSKRTVRHASTGSPYSSSRSARATELPSSSLGRRLGYDNLDAEPIETLPRLKQATDSTPDYTTTNANGDLECQNCDYVCKPARQVAFERHVDQHYRNVVSPKGPVLCCGVPVAQRDLPQYRGKVSPDASEKRFYGQKMVGGCGKSFSRPDSLKRHLDMPHGPCFGDLLGDWHPRKPRKRY